jgi:hypothetical protein
MSSGGLPPIEDRVREAFATLESTTLLLEEWLNQRTHASEFMTLALARIDALANLAMTSKSTQAEKFTTFARTYGGNKSQLELVAVPNWYMEMFVKFVTLPGIIPKDGRLFALDANRDREFLRFISDSDLPISEVGVTAFMHKVSAWLQKKYRTTATQARTKPSLDSSANVLDHLRACSSEYRKGLYDQPVESLRPWLKQFTIEALLYREYRSGIIHEYPHDIDERFFDETGPYITTRYHAWDETIFLEVALPGPWLVSLYKNSIRNYETALTKRKKLPIGLWLEVCDTEKELQYLDDSSVNEVKPVKFAL